MPTVASTGNQAAAATPSVSQSYLVLPPGFTGAFDPNILISAGYGLQVHFAEFSLLHKNVLVGQRKRV